MNEMLTRNLKQKKVSFFLIILFLLVLIPCAGYSYKLIGLYWNAADIPVHYSINSAGSADTNVFSAVQASFNTWTNVTGSSLAFNYDGTTTNTNGGANDGTNLIVWVESGWVYEASAIAITTTFWESGHYITDTDIEFNGANYTWSNSGEAGKMDVQNIATHEIGHIAGLADLYDSSDSENTMYGLGAEGETKARTLEPDDEAGLRFLYGPGGPTDDHGNTYDTATSAEVYTLVNGNIELIDDADYFSFYAAAGESYNIEITLDSLEDSVLYLYGTDGTTLITSDDDGGVWHGSKISWQCNTSGMYYLKVTSFDSYFAGRYTLTISMVDNTSPITTASPAGGTYDSPQSVTLTCSDSGSGCANTYYTTDGSTPTTLSPVYTSPISISTKVTLKFFSVDRAGNKEGVKSESYTITYPLSIIKTGNGSGAVMSEPPGINCGADCTHAYSYGTTVLLVQAPATGSFFAGWSGVNCTWGVTINEAKTCTAIFNLISYTLTVTKGGAGTGTVTSSPAGIDCGADCTEAYEYNTYVTLTATASAGSTFAGWSGTGGCIGTGTCVLPISAAKAVTAGFTLDSEALQLSLIKAGTGTGTVTSSPAGINCGEDCSEIYSYNTPVTLTATASAGSTFTGWSGDTDCSDGQVTIDMAKSCTAAFKVSSVSIDYGFNPNVNDLIESIAVQTDGKILIGGSFTTIGGTTRNRIARLNADGSLDATFNPNVNGNYVDSIAMQTDGKILIGGGFWTIGGTTRNYIARLNADGSLDATFNPNLNMPVFSILVQADGKILVGGFFTTIGGTTRNRIARLNADGSLDASFNPNANNSVYSIALQPDGKILIGGDFSTIGGTTRNRIARLNADGSLDAAFNPNVYDHVYSQVNSIALQPDGKILIGGGFSTIGGTTRNCIARLNSDGSLDAAFNPNATGTVYSIALQVDGKILISGWFTTISGTPCNYIARLNSDGSLDATFLTNVNSAVISITVQADGKILIGGNFTTISGSTKNKIARLSCNEAALQELQTSANTTVRWMRSGVGPELYNVWFESSSDMASWTMLGTGSRISGGWEINGLNLPYYMNIYIRARGYAKGGRFSGSSSIIESVKVFNLPTNTLTVIKAGTGSGKVTSNPTGIDCGIDCSEAYNFGTTVTLTPTNGTCSEFAGWSGDLDCTDGQVTMDAAKSCIASFDALPAEECSGYDIQLNQNWNLISLPSQPIDTSINTVLDPVSGLYNIVWSYQDGNWTMSNPSTPIFNTLDTIEAGKGYWIYLTAPATLTVSGDATSNVIQLVNGWNLVGYNSNSAQPIADVLASIDGKYISVWAFINGEWQFYAPGNIFNTLETMQPGYGYWINTTEACTWTLP